MKIVHNATLRYIDVVGEIMIDKLLDFCWAVLVAVVAADVVVVIPLSVSTVTENPLNSSELSDLNTIYRVLPVEVNVGRGVSPMQQFRSPSCVAELESPVRHKQRKNVV